MIKEDIESVFKECIRNCTENGFLADLEDMTADELACELLDGNDCFEEEDREALVEISRAWMEERAGFNVGKRTEHYGHYARAAEPQACAYKGTNTPDVCPVCRALPGEACRPSEQEKQREREWMKRRIMAP